MMELETRKIGIVIKKRVLEDTYAVIWSNQEIEAFTSSTDELAPGGIVRYIDENKQFVTLAKALTEAEVLLIQELVQYISSPEGAKSLSYTLCRYLTPCSFKEQQIKTAEFIAEILIAIGGGG